MRTALDWYGILTQCRVKPSIAVAWANVFYDTVHDAAFSAGDDDVKNFLGQVLHESAGLTRLEENLNYSAERLMQVWPARFATLAHAQLYAGQPQALAERVYGGRMGNTGPGDGARFIGRGLIQITGRANYQFVGDLLGQDLTGRPELLTQPHCALRASIAWWEKRIPDSALNDIPRVTRLVNGGLGGLAERTDLTGRAARVLA